MIDSQRNNERRGEKDYMIQRKKERERDIYIQKDRERYND